MCQNHLAQWIKNSPAILKRGPFVDVNLSNKMEASQIDHVVLHVSAILK